MRRNTRNSNRPIVPFRRDQEERDTMWLSYENLLRTMRGVQLMYPEHDFGIDRVVMNRDMMRNGRDLEQSRRWLEVDQSTFNTDLHRIEEAIADLELDLDDEPLNDDDWRVRGPGGTQADMEYYDALWENEHMNDALAENERRTEARDWAPGYGRYQYYGVRRRQMERGQLWPGNNYN